MKNIILTFTLFFLVCCGTSIQTVFTNMEESTDETYGYTISNPIRIGYSSPEKSIDYTYLFLESLRDSNGKPLNLLYRLTVQDKNYKKSFWEKTPKRYGDSGHGGLLDCYVLTKNNGRDTLNIYVDIYNDEPLYIPKGLQFVR